MIFALLAVNVLNEGFIRLMYPAVLCMLYALYLLHMHLLEECLCYLLYGNAELVHQDSCVM